MITLAIALILAAIHAHRAGEAAHEAECAKRNAVRYAWIKH